MGCFHLGVMTNKAIMMSAFSYIDLSAELTSPFFLSKFLSIESLSHKDDEYFT